MLKWLILACFLFITFEVYPDNDEFLSKARQEGNRGNYKDALSWINKILKAETSQVLQCQAYLEMARLHEILGDLEQSNSYILSADSLNRILHSDTLQVRILLALGHHHLVFERNKTAMEHIENAVKLAETIEDKRYKALSFEQLSSVHHQLGDYHKSLNYLEEAERYLSQGSGSKKDLIMIYKKRGDNFYLLHEIMKSGIEYEKSHKLASGFYAPTHDLILRLHNDLGAVYSDLGETEKARYHLNKTILQEAEIGANHSIADAYYYLSLLESSESNYPTSLRHAKKSLELFTEVYGTFSYWACAGWVNLADMYYFSGEIEKAAENYHRAFMSNDSIFHDPHPGSNPEFVNALSKVYYIVAMMEKAKKLLELYRSKKNENDLYYAYTAYQFLLKAIREQRVFYGASAVQLDFGEDISEIYGLALECNYHLYDKTKDKKYFEEAIQIAEQGKAYYLSLATPSSLKLENWLDNDDAELLQTYRNREIKGELQFDEQRDYESKLTDLRASYPEVYFQWFDLQNIDLDRVKKLYLDEDEMILEYVVAEKGLHVLAICKDQTQHLFKQLPEESDSLLLAFRDNISERKKDETLESGYKIFRLLLDSIDIPAHIKKLKIIPDHLLHYVPFEALITDPGNDGLPSYLIQRFEISYEHSIRLGMHHRDPSIEPLKYYGFAPTFNEYQPIPMADDEVNSITKITEGNSFLENDASVENLRKIAKEAGVLHFSTHAFIDQEDPSFSYLVLRSDSLATDQKVYYSLISSLNLNAKMVTLSSCNTGYGKYTHGEGVLSLARSFALAGSPSIIMSLWPAADQSSSFIMIDFYQGLKNGLEKSEALRIAKLNYLDNADNISGQPYFWAHLVLIGNESPINFEPVQQNRDWLWFFLIIPVVVGIFYFKRKKSFK